jgi:hypothetical protein
MGDRAVYCARLESVCTERYRGFESPPIRGFFRLLLIFSYFLRSRRSKIWNSCRNFSTLPSGSTPRKFTFG